MAATDTTLPKWKAEKTNSPQAATHRWALVYDPSPGGRDNADGTRSFSMRFPALLLYEGLTDPEKAAHELAEMLNQAEATSTNQSGSS
ncbi:MAG: hypothetical protein AAFR53_12045 [Pseudomonadota bacterium]